MPDTGNCAEHHVDRAASTQFLLLTAPCYWLRRRSSVGASRQANPAVDPPPVWRGLARNLLYLLRGSLDCAAKSAMPLFARLKGFSGPNWRPYGRQSLAAGGHARQRIAGATRRQEQLIALKRMVFMSSLSIPTVAAPLPAANARPHGHGHGHKKDSPLDPTATDTSSSTAAQIPVGSAQTMFGRLFSAISQLLGAPPKPNDGASPASSAGSAATPAAAAGSKVNLMA
jgi:hypothetical protein